MDLGALRRVGRSRCQSNPGLMDAVALEDWAPKSPLVVQETSVPKAKYPAIEVHAHVLGRTPDDVRA